MSDVERHEGPDFTTGVHGADIPEGAVLQGRVGAKAVIVARVDGLLYAIGAECSHYHAPLAEGLIKDGAIRCPWHHACFSLKTGEAIAAPAFDALPTYDVEERDGMIYAQEKRREAETPRASSSTEKVVIVGGGAGGFAAAEMLRRRGYPGDVIMLSSDAYAPYDRPNCSKDFLSGDAPLEWMPLRDESFYRAQGIDVRLNTEAESLDIEAKCVKIRDGESVAYDILILATGAEPQRPNTPGLDGEAVHVLRTLEDARSLIAAAKTATSVAVIGASFIGLEVAAAMRKRGLEVHVVAPESVPLARVLGEEVGSWVKHIHEHKGVVFHLGQKVESYVDGVLKLEGAPSVIADLVVLGVGVKPRLGLAQGAGLTIDNGVVVDDRLRAADNIYAIGDIARYPEPISGKLVRIEHWVHAQRQGQHVARQILGEDAPFKDTPFFWSAHYDKAVHYSGHAEGFDPPTVDGSLQKYDAEVQYKRGDTLLAVATIGRDLASLVAEGRFDDEVKG